MISSRRCGQPPPDWTDMQRLGVVGGSVCDAPLQTTPPIDAFGTVTARYSGTQIPAYTHGFGPNLFQVLSASKWVCRWHSQGGPGSVTFRLVDALCRRIVLEAKRAGFSTVANLLSSRSCQLFDGCPFARAD